MTIAVQIIGVLFMLTLMFIGIWSFIIANKSYNQLKYKNYLLEKIASHLALLTEKSLSDNSPIKIENANNDEEIDSLKSEEEILENIKELVDNPPLFDDIELK
ncbi:hypothetical protein [uncultured Clostridium sp.]|jgi:hypothetical protein|uniref:hypothetical protein n=1 Tax=uncultured Clostridium sp. TaxID=59620 RepID=UPI00262537EC|nr:hypothetical protein [uncultured Clostridium sp.]